MKGYGHTWIVALNSALLQTIAIVILDKEDDEMTIDKKKMLRKLKE